MEDIPYTTPDEDPFVALPIRPPRRRRSSMLDRWIADQQLSAGPSQLLPDGRHRPNTRSNPWLAYPEISKPEIRDETSTIHSYDLVEDSDLPAPIPYEPDAPSNASTPRSQRSSKFIAPSLRSISLTLRSASTTSSRGHPSTTATSSPRKSFFSIGQRSGAKHGRSSSLSMLGMIQTQSPPQSPSPTTTKWRPSVLGHFSAPSQVTVQDSEAPSRPSFSSTLTGTSTTSTTYLGRSGSSPSQLSLVSSLARHRSRSHGAASSLTAWSESYSQRPSDTESVGSRVPSPTVRQPLQAKLSAHPNKVPESSPGSSRRMLNSRSKASSKMSLSGLSSLGQRKKRLVISGIHPDDFVKIEAAKRWCESFGELSHISKLPNGDLHITFRSPEVADMVCRLRTQVFIASVGSVQLSWFIGSSPSNGH